MRTARALIVMPFSRSRSIESSTCSIISRWVTVPVASSSRSASVDLPWSIWAMMLKLRMRSRSAILLFGDITHVDDGRNKAGPTDKYTE